MSLLRRVEIRGFSVEHADDGSCMVYWQKDGERCGLGFSRGASNGMWLERLLAKGVAEDTAKMLADECCPSLVHECAGRLWRPEP